MELPEGEIVVVAESLRTEAKRWHAFSDEMHVIASDVGQLFLDEPAFWCGDGISGTAAPIYAELLEFVRTRCFEGSTEFEEIGGALIRAADGYDGTDEVSSAMLKEIYGDV